MNRNTLFTYVLIIAGTLLLSLKIKQAEDPTVFATEKPIEAEAGIINGPMQRYSASDASGGFYLMNHYTTTRRLEDPDLQQLPDVSYTIDIPEDGDYYIWLRAKVPASGEIFGQYLSIYAGTNNMNYNACIVKLTRGWEWQRLTNLRLKKGRRTLDFKHKDFGFGIDMLYVTITGADLSGVGMNPTREEILRANFNVPTAIDYPPPTVDDGLGLDFPKPPAEHPRLFLRECDFEALREKIKNPVMKTAWDRIVAASNEQIDGMLDAPIDGRENYSMGIIQAIEAKALMYVLNKDRNQGRNAVEAMLNFFGTVKFRPSTNDITRVYGRFMLASALVYDWCYDLMTDEEKSTMIVWMETMASKMELGWPVVRQGAVTGHGSEMQLMRDLMAAGIAMYDEKKEMYDRAAGRFFKHFVPARTFFYPAGFHHQGSSYGITRFNCEMWATYIFDRMGYPNIFGIDQGKLPYYWKYLRRPDGQYLRNGDDFKEKVAFGQYWNNKTDALAGYYFKDPIIIAEAARQGGIGTDSDYLYDFLFFSTDVQPNNDTSILPLSRYFPEPYGALYARTGWEEGMDARTVVAEMKIGVYNFGNHQHLDAGNFQLYYKGPLAIESGIYEGSIGGYGSAHDFNYHKRTIAHNTMLVYDPDEKFPRNSVNDGGQRFPNNGREPSTLEMLLSQDYKTGEVLAHQTGPDSLKPEFSYLKGDIAQAYSNKVKKFQRSFVFLNLFNNEHPAALIVFDRVDASRKDYKKYWLLHSVEEPVIKGNTTTISRCEKGYNGKMVNTTLLPSPENLVIQKVGGKGNEYSVFGKNFPQHYSSDKNSFDGAAWRMELSPKNSSLSDHFLNVMQVMDHREGPAPLRVHLLEAAQVTGALLADRVVFFSKSGDRLEKANFSFTGNGTFKIMVADLQPGAWKVGKQGEKTSDHRVASSGGVLYFEGTSGKYTLTRSGK